MRMAAIYARVSSERQREENTIASQTASLIEFAKGHNLEVPEEWVFEDEGYSGATLERPGLERVRDLAAEGQIQVVLAYAPDRLSRKYAYQILLIEEFARHGVETLFVKAPQGDSAEDQLLVQFQGMIAEYERAQILERSRRGKRHRAHSGEISVMSGAPYGYRYMRKTDEVPAAYIVHEPEAGVVRRVYEMYTVEGLTVRGGKELIFGKAGGAAGYLTFRCTWQRTRRHGCCDIVADHSRARATREAQNKLNGAVFQLSRRARAQQLAQDQAQVERADMNQLPLQNVVPSAQWQRRIPPVS